MNVYNDAQTAGTPRIGVHDFDSLCACLKHNFEQAFPGETMRDPQDAIQRMAAAVILARNRS